ncbi:MAG: radical SAM protein [Deltaproteobacteria bacterium]|nr:radical SAM protein [Deltaproteobacteria bacterium]
MTDSIPKLAAKLLANGIRFQYLKRTGRPGRPQAISLEVTHRCIAKCIMCNIWKISHEVPELFADDWLRFLASDLFSDLRELDITGGEPFIRKDLIDLFSGIASLKQKNLRKLKSIAVTTNGFLTDRILEYMEQILPVLRDKDIDLVTVCAMDAIGEMHEKIRNYPKAWSHVDETIQGLKELRERFSNLIIGLKTTILPVNIAELDEIEQYADTNRLFTIISPCIITDARYLNPDRADDLVFSTKNIQKMIEFYESESFRWSYHGDTLVQFFKTGLTKKPCSCGFNYFFVRSTGELFLCPLINLSVGNIKEKPLQDLLFSREASRFRKNVGRFPECRRCTEPGLERYALPYEGLMYLSFLLGKGCREFYQLHKYMGLDKYFKSLLSGLLCNDINRL